MKATLIPARGTVEFFVWDSLRDDDVPELDIVGPRQWSRPVVGLLETGRIDSEDSVLGRYLPYEPVVTNECGLLYTAYDYRESLMGGCHWDHASHLYWPHIDGPVSDAPRIRDLSSPPSVTA